MRSPHSTRSKRHDPQNENHCEGRSDHSHIQALSDSCLHSEQIWLSQQAHCQIDTLRTGSNGHLLAVAWR